MNLHVKGELPNVGRLHYFLLYSMASMAFIYTGNHFLITEDLYYSFFEGQMSVDHIAEFIDMSQRVEWIVYLIVPLYLLVKFFVVAACLSVGTLLYGYNIEFRKLFHVAMFADFVFTIPPIVKLAWFGLIATDYDLTDIQYFLPLSVMSLFNPNDIELWLIYPLQVMNAFELVYWFVLALGLKIVLRESYPKMLALVSLSYGPALVLWVMFIVFISLNLS